MILKYSADIDGLFFTKLDDVAAELGANPREMLAVMYSESGVRADAWNDNPKHLPPEQRWNASGIIQFMPATLRGLGYMQGHTTFRRLNATEQLVYARRYYSAYKGHLGSIGGLYTATFLPAYVSKAGDPSYVLTASGKGAHPERLGWAFAPNAVFDANKDYAITVGELEDAVRRNAQGARWNELVARLEHGDIVDEGPNPHVIDLRTTLGLQEGLTALGYTPGALDGLPGPRTRAALVAFQQASGLIGDGIFGPLSRGAMELALATLPPDGTLDVA